MSPPPVALVLAGGRGERMARSGRTLPKPLVPVAGRPLLGHALARLAEHGVTDVRLAVARESGDAVFAYALAAFRGTFVHLGLLREEEPLGTAGALGRLAGVPGDVLLVNADVLTDLDLSALVAAHERSGADLTLAAHFEAWRLPFGALETDAAGRVLRYDEKPTLRRRIASGVSVVGEAARDLVGPGGERLGVPELVARALDAGLAVRTFEHEASWIDVNDEEALARAEARLAEDPDAFGAARAAEQSRETETGS